MVEIVVVMNQSQTLYLSGKDQMSAEKCGTAQSTRSEALFGTHTNTHTNYMDTKTKMITWFCCTCIGKKK